MVEKFLADRPDPEERAQLRRSVAAFLRGPQGHHASVFLHRQEQVRRLRTDLLKIPAS